MRSFKALRSLTSLLLCAATVAMPALPRLALAQEQPVADEGPSLPQPVAPGQAVPDGLPPPAVAPETPQTYAPQERQAPVYAPTAPAPNRQVNPVLDARIDAENDTNVVLWFGAGCLLTLVGVLVAYVVTPDPSAARLIGHDSNYVTVYTQEYRSTGTGTQGRAAIYGCLTTTIAYVALVVLTLRTVN